MKIDRQLRQLAGLNGVQTSFVDAANQRQAATPEVLAGVLAALGVPASNEAEIRDSLRASRLRPFRRGIEPVIVAWEKRDTKITCHLPPKLASKRLKIGLQFEGGREEELAAPARAIGTREMERERFTSREFHLGKLPLGYHTLEIVAGNSSYRTLILSAPVKSFADASKGKRWGAFLPMYAAHSKASWGAGNVSDWERLSQWIGSQGGTVAGTLPLLAGFLDYPICEPSPYSPASRLFWNEFYLDITKIPEFASCREAQKLVASKKFQNRLRCFRRDEIIDYREQWAARRSVLELLAKYFFSKASPRRAEFEQFLRERPDVNEYAAFRATCEKLKTSWQNWPQRLREGRLRENDYAAAARRFHLYVQWLAHGQMAELVRRSEQNGVELYLDLPLGVNPDGYDVWRERDSFALGANAGAPPDLFFSKGQDWGFAPLHPRRIRELGYRHVLDFLRFQMQHARLLRIDHVMGLHRLYWVPRGFEARQGTYVNYPAEELHAIFNLESRRHRTRLVGENLGTVPKEVNRAMARHGLLGMYVTQFEQRLEPEAALAKPPKLSVASLDTHDTPMFAAFWPGDDLLERVRLGLLRSDELKAAKADRKQLNAALAAFLKKQTFLKTRKAGAREVLGALLAWLKAQGPEIVLVSLEDLWLEKRPQNVPGTSTEHPNWRRKARLTLEELFHDQRLSRLLPT
ncbi:MAG TPA: 4-alpha-glucanotransferase [Candidatus Angelobacter sp.]|nr:4-alpha-glucanotransferase [Candidatus Angelobacter sp.]